MFTAIFRDEWIAFMTRYQCSSASPHSGKMAMQWDINSSSSNLIKFNGYWLWNERNSVESKTKETTVCWNFNVISVEILKHYLQSQSTSLSFSSFFPFGKRTLWRQHKSTGFRWRFVIWNANTLSIRMHIRFNQAPHFIRMLKVNVSSVQLFAHCTWTEKCVLFRLPKRWSHIDKTSLLKVCA